MSFLSALLIIISSLSQQSLTIDDLSAPEAIKISYEGDIIEEPISLGMIIKAKSALVLDNQNNNIVFAKNPQEVSSIASLTKLMSNIIIWESITENKKGKELDTFLNKQCPLVKEEDKEARKISIYPGESAKIKDLIEVNLIASVNNATQSLANLVEKDILPEKKFVDLMNEKAKILKMTHTYFYEPTGLNPQNKSTAEDLAILTDYFFKIDNFKKISQMKSISFPIFNKTQTHYLYFKNTNELLDNFISVYGKTGYLEESGYCFAGKFEVNGNEYTIVLLGDPSSEERFQDIKALTWWVEKNQKAKI